MSLPRDTTPTLRYTPTVLESLQENSKKVALACTYLANTELLSHIQLFQLDLAKEPPNSTTHGPGSDASPANVAETPKLRHDL
jgi:hypothetical protein